MKITHNKVGQNLNLVDGSKAERGDAATKAKTTANIPKAPSLFDDPNASAMSDSARVDLSTKAQDAKRIKELAMQAPDVDQAKVEKFRRLIDEGKYKVDAKKVADKMVNEELALGGFKPNEDEQ